MVKSLYLSKILSEMIFFNLIYPNKLILGTCITFKIHISHLDMLDITLKPISSPARIVSSLIPCRVPFLLSLSRSQAESVVS